MYTIQHPFPSSIIDSITETGLGGPARISCEPSGAFTRVCLQYTVSQLAQDDTFVCIRPGFEPDFWWSPHLTPEPGYIAQQHIFRTPALIARSENATLLLIPDVRQAAISPIPWYLDIDAPNRSLYIGLSLSEVHEHVLFRKRPGAVFDGTVTLAFYVLALPEKLDNPFRPVLDFFWTQYGQTDLQQHLGYMTDLSPYAQHAYQWAFDRWQDAVWQQFEIDGQTVGAPVFIVNVTQSPNYPGPINERELRSIWNQAWFCSLRSASGLYRYARRCGNADLMKKALLTKELALSFPQQNGLFDSVIATEMETVIDQGVRCNRSCGWQTRYYGNSNRNPFSREVRTSPKHILDMAFLCYYMLIWYEELEADPRLLTYVTAFADRLIQLQQSDGFYPAWVDENGRGLGPLDRSPESAMGAAVLFKLHRLTHNAAYLSSARRAADAIMTQIVPEGRWEDFETYWSCSVIFDDHVGQKIPRNAMYKQCNFSMYFTALALWEGYQSTAQMHYLTGGIRVLDELLMTQSSYQPANLPIPVIGGFGVMNADAELNDLRSSLFAPLLLEYARLLPSSSLADKLSLTEEYRRRGLAVLKASFSLMYCPENPASKAQWEKKWSFFGPADYGFMMENYGHGGVAGDEGVGIGEFTIFDWGNGAAAEAYQLILDRGLLNAQS